MKRTIALFLSLMMLASSMAVGVFATDELSPAADADTGAAEAQAEDTDAVIEDTDNAAPEVSEEAAAPEDEVLPEEEPALEAANGAVSTQEAANEGETTTQGGLITWKSYRDKDTGCTVYMDVTSYRKLFTVQAEQVRALYRKQADGLDGVLWEKEILLNGTHPALAQIVCYGACHVPEK